MKSLTAVLLALLVIGVYTVADPAPPNLPTTDLDRITILRDDSLSKTPAPLEDPQLERAIRDVTAWFNDSGGNYDPAALAEFLEHFYPGAFVDDTPKWVWVFNPNTGKWFRVCYQSSVILTQEITEGDAILVEVDPPIAVRFEIPF